MKSAMVTGVIIACAVLAGPAHAQRSKPDPDDPYYQFDYDPSLKKDWQEAEVPLPPPPDTANLVQLQTAPTTSHEVLVDTASVSVGRDKVVRLSYVIVAGSARNTLHEGIRCTSRQSKTYAYGNPDGSWQAAKGTDWTAIRELGGNAYHFDLYRLVCSEQTDSPRSPRDIVRRLKYQVENNIP